LNKSPTLKFNLSPKTSGRAKIPSPRPPSLLPARIARFAGEPMGKIDFII
jgi:hypothetical protein